MVKWRLGMESKRIKIKLKVPSSYHESQYIMDYLDAALTIKAKTFKAEVNIICNWYLCRNSDKWNATYISGEIIKAYNNMFKDGTWKRELGKNDQIIALSTKLQNFKPTLRIKARRSPLLQLRQWRKPLSTRVLEAIEAALVAQSKICTLSQHGVWLRQRKKSAWMAKTIFGAQSIIGVVVPSIMKCMPPQNLWSWCMESLHGWTSHSQECKLN